MAVGSGVPNQMVCWYDASECLDNICWDNMQCAGMLLMLGDMQRQQAASHDGRIQQVYVWKIIQVTSCMMWHQRGFDEH